MVPARACARCGKVRVGAGRRRLSCSGRGSRGVVVEAEDARADGGAILVVCTGNVCRSPYIERRLAQLCASSGIVVSSAGTGALVGSPIDPGSLGELRARGASTAEFAARQVTERMVADADLVLTATRVHRAEIVRLLPRSMGYCFALSDFADLVADADAEVLAEFGDPELGGTWTAHVAGFAAERRGTIPPRPREESDIFDPYGQGRSAFARMAREVERALPAVTAVLSRQRWRVRTHG
ncbi:low molecular weight phosphatase family protein [Terrabacter sp. BE26]|uniref:arsenate reductase/protein-tyrosine-phosphatase family protein n=1 Tax=Terrabacter sp. BE26 TaxID=2898152 RepID=UPI0035BE29A9